MSAQSLFERAAARLEGERLTYAGAVTVEEAHELGPRPPQCQDIEPAVPRAELGRDPEPEPRQRGHAPFERRVRIEAARRKRRHQQASQRSGV